MPDLLHNRPAKRRMGVSFALAAILSLAACGHATPPKVTVPGGWVRATAGTATAAYVTIRNDGGADLLTAVSTPAATEASLHETNMDGGVMRMRALDGGLPIGAKSSVIMKSGGVHIMLEGLHQPITPGASIPLTLTFRRSPATTIDLPAAQEDPR